jgi:hypothetical protein
MLRNASGVWTWPNGDEVEPPTKPCGGMPPDGPAPFVPYSET